MRRMPSERTDGLSVEAMSVEALAALSMTEVIRLQDLLSRELKRRFEKQLALGFSDVVGSTDYFARFGDEAGRRLQQRHFDLIGQVALPAGGRIVDTAGDGAFVVFPSVEAAVGAFIELQKQIVQGNLSRAREQQLRVRVGIHWGPVLTDDNHVTGDSVNLAARVTGSASPSEIRITNEAMQELSNIVYRLSTRPLGPIELKGISRLVTVFALDWRERDVFPDAVRILETGEEIQLPNQDTIRFGRLKENDGLPANDIVLLLPDEKDARKISRWHFELRRHPHTFMLRPVSEQLTELDGHAVAKGTEVPLKPGSLVRVGRVATLEFVSLPNPSARGAGDETIANR
jgi:class 3 adenylate cyclase